MADLYVVTDGGMRNLLTGDVVTESGGLVGIYNGGSAGSDDAPIAASGVAFDLGSTYYNAGNNLLSVLDEDRLSRGCMPIVGMASKNYRNLGADSYMDWGGIAAGVFDEQLVEWGNTLAAYDTELWFAFEIEAEVKLNRGDVPAGWGYAEFRDAYRRLVQIMRPLAPAVKFAYWCGGSDREAIDQLYPGDDVVDLIGWDPYVGGGESASTTPEQCWGSFKTWLDGRSWGAGKPYGLFECGYDRGHGDAAAIAFWEATPATFKDLGLSWVTLFNRDSGPNTDAEITSQAVWDAYGEAMRAIQNGEG